MEDVIEMTPEQQVELARLSKDLPTFEEMLQSKDAFWRYYYALCTRTCYEFFKDPELAREAVLPLYEHWCAAHERYTPDRMAMSRLFSLVSNNFCINFLRDNSYGPEIIYQTEDEVEEDDEEDAIRRVDKSAFVEDYPSSGVNYDDPERLSILGEEQVLTDERVANIRDNLFPGDREVFDLLLESYNSDEIANILERTVASVENSYRRIREAAGE